MRTSVILLIFALVACAVAENIYLSYWSGSGSCSGTSTKAFNVGDNKCYGIVDNYLSYKNRTGNNVYFCTYNNNVCTNGETCVNTWNIGECHQLAASSYMFTTTMTSGASALSFSVIAIVSSLVALLF